MLISGIVDFEGVFGVAAGGPYQPGKIQMSRNSTALKLVLTDDDLPENTD